MTSKDTILHTLRTSRDFLAAAVSDLTAAEMVYLPPTGSNCAAFILGHLVWVERQVLLDSEVPDVPDMDAAVLDAFARGQAPPADVKAFGDPLQFAARFAELRAITMKYVRGVPAELLDRPVPAQGRLPFPLFGSVGERLNFVGLHSIMHAGQITCIRRGLGRPPLL